MLAAKPMTKKRLTSPATMMVCQYRHAKSVTAWREPNMGLGNDVTGMPSFVVFLILAIGIPSDPLSPRPQEYTRFSVRKCKSRMKGTMDDQSRDLRGNT